LNRNEENRKDGLELINTFLIAILVLILFAGPPSFVVVSRLGLLRFAGTGLVTSLPGQLAVGIFWAYFFSIDGVIIVLTVFLILIFASSMARWLLEMIW
jgi:hypothetical protein